MPYAVRYGTHLHTESARVDNNFTTSPERALSSSCYIIFMTLQRALIT